MELFTQITDLDSVTAWREWSKQPVLKIAAKEKRTLGLGVSLQ